MVHVCHLLSPQSFNKTDMAASRRNRFDHSVMRLWCRGGFEQKHNARMEIGMLAIPCPSLQRRSPKNLVGRHTCKIQFKWWNVDLMIVLERFQAREFMVNYGSPLGLCYIPPTLLLVTNIPSSFPKYSLDFIDLIAYPGSINTTLQFTLCGFDSQGSTLYTMPPRHLASQQTSCSAPYIDLLFHVD